MIPDPYLSPISPGPVFLKTAFRLDVILPEQSPFAKPIKWKNLSPPGSKSHKTAKNPAEGPFFQAPPAGKNDYAGIRLIRIILIRSYIHYLSLVPIPIKDTILTVNIYIPGFNG